MDDDTKNHASFLILSHLIFCLQVQEKAFEHLRSGIEKALLEGMDLLE